MGRHGGGWGRGADQHAATVTAATPPATRAERPWVRPPAPATPPAGTPRGGRGVGWGRWGPARPEEGSGYRGRADGVPTGTAPALRADGTTDRVMVASPVTVTGGRFEMILDFPRTWTVKV